MFRYSSFQATPLLLGDIAVTTAAALRIRTSRVRSISSTNRMSRGPRGPPGDTMATLGVASLKAKNLIISGRSLLTETSSDAALSGEKIGYFLR